MQKPTIHIMLTLAPANRSQLLQSLQQNQWVMACLCAAWCNTCTAYRQEFAGLQERFPQLQLVWIDIEDEAEVVGDLDIENFPTLLIARGADTAFFGTVLPEVALAERLLQAQLALDEEALRRQAARNPAQVNLLHLLQNC